jgi:hypothetical protein
MTVCFQKLDYPENFGRVVCAKIIYFINDGITAVFA